MAETRAAPASGGNEGHRLDRAPRANDTIKVTYRPGVGDPQRTEVFGHKLKAGEAVSIPARFADKARGNPFLQVQGEKTFGDDRKDEDEVEEQEEATFEDNVARERADEYLSGAPISTNGPGEAERIARAQDQALALRESKTSDDKDKPRPDRKGK